LALLLTVMEKQVNVAGQPVTQPSAGQHRAPTEVAFSRGLALANEVQNRFAKHPHVEVS